MYQLDGVRFPQSLYGLVNSQLGDEQITKLKVKQETPVKVLDGQVQSCAIAPGEEVVGVVALAGGIKHTNPTILRLQFPSPGIDPGDTFFIMASQSQVTAFLVR